jgi:dipeptide/tripeptide permease
MLRKLHKFRVYLNYRGVAMYVKLLHLRCTLAPVTLTSITVSQRKYNHKATLSTSNTVCTFSTGSTIRCMRIKHDKMNRRSKKGVLIFLNFIKRVFQMKYLQAKSTFFLFSVVGIDYHIRMNKRFIARLLKFEVSTLVYLLYGTNVSFTRLKNKKVKSIKKRLRKKILKNFLISQAKK